jgi:PAS domain S-box-containing protein
MASGDTAMTYQLADLLDIPRMQHALDSLYLSSKIPSAIIDNNGKIHTSSGWQDICTKFHRVHPEAEKHCIESDLYISRHIHEANPSIVYKCPHGLVDAATPIIIEGEHLGNVFTGQLFLEDPDLDRFRSQARRYGFDEGKYLDAVKKVPVISGKALRENLAFIAQLTEMLIDVGLKHKEEIHGEQLIRESEERFRRIFRENSSVMLLMDPHSGRIEDANPAAAAFYGYPEDVLRTMRIGQINILSEKLISIERARALRKERNHFIFPHQLASGEIRTVEVHSSPVEVGGRLLLFSIINDITDRMRSEATARIETTLRNVLLDNLPCIALVLKKQSREIVACNQRAKEYGAVVGKTCHDALVSSTGPCPFCMASELWDTGKNKFIEVEYLGKFWRGYWVPFSDEHYVHYIFDITDQKKIEKEKERLQVQLQQAMKMEAVGRLAGGVAHDFNNLLTAIIGNISLAHAKLSRAEPAAGMLAEANKAAERAATLTQQLLAFSRQQIIDPKVLDLNDLIADVRGMLSSLIREDIEIHTKSGVELWPVKIDPGQFGQIIVNLVVNARDAMPDGGKIIIETSNVDLDESYCDSHPYVKPGQFVMLTLSDTGCGMSEEVKAHIFEPFFTTKPKGSGTGLGLATTYGIVKQAGGSIEVYSEVGMGTTFRIYLPRNGGQASKLPGNDQSTGLLGGSETLLVVEDDEIVRDLCVMFLENLGYRVLNATNGKDAIALSMEHNGRIDLLLTDVVMPGMNGGELATQLVLHRPEIKVLFTSGYTEDVIVHHGVMDEEVSFIGKPYTPSALAKKIREVLVKA